MSIENKQAQDQKTYVIIGGVAGGMSTATRLRRLNEFANIIVLERSGYVSFANCGLPYYVGGVIEDRNALLLQTPRSLAFRFDLDVRCRTEALSIDPEAKTVEVRDIGTDETYTLNYDKLVLSPGARPIMPPIPGIERALPLRDIEDTDRMANATRHAKTAVVIGGGFIGIEVAENLVHLGMDVTLVEAAAQVMAPVDPELAALVHDELRRNGVKLVLNQSVTAISEDSVTVTDGTEIQADVVVASIGVRPDTELAKGAGLTVGDLGGISINEQFQTSDPHIYAIGDAVEKVDALTGEPTLLPLANTANRQGRILADILSGRSGKERPVIGTSIVAVFDLQVAATGWNEKRLKAAGKPYRAIHTHPLSHAGYYPGAATMSLKLLVDPETDAILGAQGVGSDAVDKRIDVIATAMAGGITASDLIDLELAYAPPFGSAKDPVNMLGYINCNIADGLTETIQWYEVEEYQEKGYTLVDVRTPGEFARGAIPGSVNFELDRLRANLDKLPEGDLIINCAVGLRGHVAAQILRQNGRKAYNLDGGYKTWVAGTSL
ncbi:MAG: FAD-dependent oxidoreductase [Actinomycetaceae bacterium]|nr:FAD-dependent oxidoreductase [Actinomycetaceae bacterium]